MMNASIIPCRPPTNPPISISNPVSAPSKNVVLRMLVIEFVSVTRVAPDNDNIGTISLAAGDKIEATLPIFYSQLGTAYDAGRALPARHTMPVVRLKREECVGFFPAGRIEDLRSDFEESRENFRDFDLVDRIATENLHLSKRAPSIGIGWTEENDAGGSHRRCKMRNSRVIADECRGHPRDRSDGAERLPRDNRLAAIAEKSL